MASRRWRRRVGSRCGLALAMLASATPPSVRAETIACWRFDEPAGGLVGTWLKDEGRWGCDLRIGRDGEMVAGRFGNALGSVSGALGQPAAGGRATTAFRAVGDSTEAPGPDPTATPLNLGAHDWTLECWLRLDADAPAEGTLFEIGAGPAGGNDVLTRVSVLPGENAFLLTGLSRASPDESGVGGRRVRYPRADGPPDEVALLHATTLALRDTALPRQDWFHVALVHRADRDELRLFVDGQPRAVASVQHRALPHGNHAYVSVGRDGRGQRALSGAIDELRISDTVDYRAAFTPSRPGLRRTGDWRAQGSERARAVAASRPRATPPERSSRTP